VNCHRRRFLRALAAAAATRAWPVTALSQDKAPITRPIPATGERVPAIGVGSWITFDVPPNHPAEAPLFPVLQTFFDRGGALIDSSPMYGYAEAVIGDLLTETSARNRMFSATKIWTPIKALGRWQFERSCRLWGVSRFDLVQIHNLLQWEAHLETLRELQAAGRLVPPSRRRRARNTTKWSARCCASGSISCSSRTTSPIAAPSGDCCPSPPSGALPS
jgi:hypothetical protein